MTYLIINYFRDILIFLDIESGFPLENVFPKFQCRFPKYQDFDPIGPTKETKMDVLDYLFSQDYD